MGSGQALPLLPALLPARSRQMSDREEIMNLIRNEYDPRPDLGRADYPALDWDDGAGRIADAILADRALLLRKHAEEIARLRDVAASAQADAGLEDRVVEAITEWV